MTLTRTEAIAIAGIELIEAVELENCEHTSRVTDGSRWAGYELFSASVRNETHIVTAYYLADSDELAEAGSLDEIDWEIDHYEVDEV